MSGFLPIGGGGGSGTPTGPASGDLSGTYPSPTVAKIENRAVSSAIPSDGYALIWSDTNNQWEAGQVGGAGPAGGDLSGIYPDPTVSKLNGDSLPTNISNGFIKRNSGNTAFEEVAFGTGPNTVCQGNDGRLSDSRAPAGSASGDLSGTYPSPTVAKIEGYAVSTSQPTDGYALIWNTSSNKWISSHTIDGITIGLPPSGIASDKGVSTTDTSNILSLWSIRSSGSGNVSTALVADVNNPTIDTNHKIVQMGWNDNSDSFTELFNFKDSEFQISTVANAKVLSTDTDGASVVAVSLGSANTFSTNGAKLLSVVNGSPSGLERMYVDYAGDVCLNKRDNNQCLGIKSLAESYTVPASADGYTAIQIPSNVLVIGTSTRVITAIPTATTFSLGVSGAKTRYASAISVNAGTTSVSLGIANITSYSATTSLLITPSSTPATATGVVRITLYYIDLTAPIS